MKTRHLGSAAKVKPKNWSLRWIGLVWLSVLVGDEKGETLDRVVQRAIIVQARDNAGGLRGKTAENKKQPKQKQQRGTNKKKTKIKQGNSYTEKTDRLLSVSDGGRKGRGLNFSGKDSGIQFVSADKEESQQ